MESSQHSESSVGVKVFPVRALLERDIADAAAVPRLSAGELYSSGDLGARFSEQPPHIHDAEEQGAAGSVLVEGDSDPGVA